MAYLLYFHFAAQTNYRGHEYTLTLLLDILVLPHLISHRGHS